MNINPDYVKCRLNLAVQYKKDAQLDKSEAQYNLIISTNPTYASAWYNLALLEKQRGELEDAEKAYKEAVKLEPENTKYWSGLSALYTLQGRGDARASGVTSVRLRQDARDDIGLEHTHAGSRRHVPKPGQ